MTSKVFTVVVSLVLGLAFATAASAQTARYPITGAAKFQIGDGLPIPIAQSVDAVAGAGVRQPTAAADPRPMQFNGSEFTHPGTPFTLGVFANNPNVFQVRTALTIQFPAGAATFSAGGRTGAATVNWCPGIDITAASQTGGCLTAAAGPGINGRIRYFATGNQFGGVARGFTGGGADVALRAGAAAPCDYNFTATCLAIFALATPAGTGAQGAAFNEKISTSGAAPPTGLYAVIVAANGAIGAVTPTGLGAGAPNPATSYGAPWTTGMIDLLNTAVGGTPEDFDLTGSDARVGGIGTISLVSGSMSDRTLSGPNANRGWLSLTVGETTPALGTWGIGALAVVLAGVAARRLRSKA